jgi:hypothetical protein
MPPPPHLPVVASSPPHCRLIPIKLPQARQEGEEGERRAPSPTAAHPHRASTASLGVRLAKLPLHGPAVPTAGTAHRTARGHPSSLAAAAGAARLSRTRKRRGQGSRARASPGRACGRWRYPNANPDRRDWRPGCCDRRPGREVQRGAADPVGWRRHLADEDGAPAVDIFFSFPFFPSFDS